MNVQMRVHILRTFNFKFMFSLSDKLFIVHVLDFKFCFFVSQS
jgi:hypothetical protein